MASKLSMQSLFCKFFTAALFIVAMTLLSSQAFAQCDGTSITNGQKQAWAGKIDLLNGPVTNQKNVDLNGDFNSPSNAQGQVNTNGQTTDKFQIFYGGTLTTLLNALMTSLNGLFSNLTALGGKYGQSSNAGSKIVFGTATGTPVISSCPATGAPVMQDYRPTS